MTEIILYCFIVITNPANEMSQMKKGYFNPDFVRDVLRNETKRGMVVDISCEPVRAL